MDLAKQFPHHWIYCMVKFESPNLIVSELMSVAPLHVAHIQAEDLNRVQGGGGGVHLHTHHTGPLLLITPSLRYFK